MMEDTTLAQLGAQLARIEAHIRKVVPPQDVRANMAEASEHIADVADTTELHSPQIAEIVAWMHARMSGDELAKQFDEQFFITKQLISIMQGARDDQVLLRGDFRRLAALLEQTLRARVDDEEAWHAGDVDRRRNSIADRRKVS
jgi:hypothetical protein